MTLLFADGFEDGAAAWVLGTAMAVGTGRYGNGVVAGSTSSDASLGFASTFGPIICGFAFKPASAAAGGIAGIFNPAATSTHVGLVRGAGGEISAYRSSGAFLLGSSAAGVVPAGAWSYIEMMAFVNDTTGSVVVRVNGVEVLNLTNQDTKDGTQAAGMLRLGINVQGTTVGNAWDDVYICDTTGSYNNDFLGEITVEHLRPVADDGVQFLGSDSNSTDNWALVDEAGVANTADYVGSSTVAQRDLYTIGASSRPGAAAVLGVTVAGVMMKSDIGTRTAKLLAKEGSGGTVRQSAELGLPGSFGEVTAVFERKGDGSQWTVADVNALRIGVEVAS